MKKMRKNGSFLSMENLDVEGGSSISEDGDTKHENTDTSNLKFDNECITLHPIYILGQAF